ncbi:MAG: hypothetical protein IIU14_06145 [Ruminococcus sp.]|nr:hypothetical protein [Ruminococcus sp.]
MNTTKKLIVLCFAALMGIMCVMPSTFSWYNHSDYQSGNGMLYSRQELPVSYAAANDITMTTEVLQMKSDGQNVDFDDKGDLIPTGNITTSNSINAQNNQYYRTTLTNSGSTDAMLSLYVSNISNQKNLYVGCVAPTITERGFSKYGSASRAINGITRVYFQPRTAKDWSTAASINVVATVNGASSTVAMSHKYTTEGTQQDVTETITGGTSYVTWYADLPAGTTEFYFQNGDLNSTSDWSRTSTFYDYRPETIISLTGYTTDDDTDHRYAQHTIHSKSKLINVTRYYDKVNIAAGQSVSVALNAKDYKGMSGVTYSVDSNHNPSNAISVNENTGSISCNSDLNSDEYATVKIKIVSSLNDVLEIPVKVTNPVTLDAVPISQNIRVPASHTENGETVNGEVRVEWYIKNKEDTGHATFNGIYFTR